jgi:hypothetical protein
VLGEIAEQYKNRVTNRSQKWGVPVLEPPDARRDNFMGAYFKQAKADQIVAIFKAREPGRLLIANGNRATSTSTMPAEAVCFVRLCPYFPFTARGVPQPTAPFGCVRKRSTSGNALTPYSGAATQNACKNLPTH